MELAPRDGKAALGERAVAGNEHARRQLASWLADRDRTEEVIEVIWLARQHGMREVRLAADLGDEAARGRLQRWLARLREHAEAGDEHAQGFLAERYIGRDLPWSAWLTLPASTGRPNPRRAGLAGAGI